MTLTCCNSLYTVLDSSKLPTQLHHTSHQSAPYWQEEVTQLEQPLLLCKSYHGWYLSLANIWLHVNAKNRSSLYLWGLFCFRLVYNKTKKFNLESVLCIVSCFEYFQERFHETDFYEKVYRSKQNVYLAVSRCQVSSNSNWMQTLLHVCRQTICKWQACVYSSVYLDVFV